MGAFIHNNNALLGLARMTTFGWVKDLCYSTLAHGVLNEAELQTVFDTFIKREAASLPKPPVTPEQVLRLTKLTHLNGVNALKNGSEITFCEEGITMIYGQNSTGKSGYYRVLENIAGGDLSQPVLGNVYKTHPVGANCLLDYKLDGVVQPTYTWDNTVATKGKFPFDRITVFDSKYTSYLVKRHAADSYLLNTHGFYDFSDFETNKDRLIQKVRSERPEREEELYVSELTALRLADIYDNYLTALQSQLLVEIRLLLGKGRNISIEKEMDDGNPYLLLKLNCPIAIENVLSEGELKAVALALLMSDLELKQTTAPIILDDPVNSLDNNIIRRFAERLIALENPIILFTHNIWLTNAILKSKKVKEYKPASLLADRTDTRKHVIPYMVISKGQEKGIIKNYDKDSPKYYLDSAKACLDTVPFEIQHAESAIQLLRKAVEMLVDEKIFLNLTPCKYRFGNQGIFWTDMFNLKRVPDALIQKLQEQYTILSSGGTHTGLVEEEDALDHDDLEDVYNELISIL